MGFFAHYDKCNCRNESDDGDNRDIQEDHDFILSLRFIRIDTNATLQFFCSLMVRTNVLEERFQVSEAKAKYVSPCIRAAVGWVTIWFSSFRRNCRSKGYRRVSLSGTLHFK